MKRISEILLNILRPLVVYRVLESVVITTISDCKKFVKKAQKQPKICQLLPRSPRPSFAYRGHKKLKASLNELLKKSPEKGCKEGAPNPAYPIPINNKLSKGFKFAMALSGLSFKSLMKPKDLRDFLKITKALSRPKWPFLMVVKLTMAPYRARPVMLKG